MPQLRSVVGSVEHTLEPQPTRKKKRRRRELPTLKQTRNVPLKGKARRPVYKGPEEDEEGSARAISEAVLKGLATLAPRTGAGSILSRIAQGAQVGSEIGEAIVKYRNRKRRKSLSEEANA